MVLYGARYSVASLSCTVGPFLAVTAATLRSGNTAAVAVFAAYAGGMGLVLTTVTVATALARDTLITRVRAAGRLVSRAGGGALLRPIRPSPARWWHYLPFARWPPRNACAACPARTEMRRRRWG